MSMLLEKLWNIPTFESYICFSCDAGDVGCDQVSDEIQANRRFSEN